MEIEAAYDCMQAFSRKAKVTVKEAINEVTNASSDLINEKINTPRYSGIDLLIILFTKTTSTFIR